MALARRSTPTATEAHSCTHVGSNPERKIGARRIVFLSDVHRNRGFLKMMKGQNFPLMVDVYYILTKIRYRLSFNATGDCVQGFKKVMRCHFYYHENKSVQVTACILEVL